MKRVGKSASLAAMAFATVLGCGSKNEPPEAQASSATTDPVPSGAATPAVQTGRAPTIPGPLEVDAAGPKPKALADPLPEVCLDSEPLRPAWGFAPKDAPPPPPPKTIAFGKAVSYTFEKRDEDWLFYDASKPVPMRPSRAMTVQDLCDRRQTKGRATDDGIFFVVIGVDVGDGGTATAALHVTYESTGNEAKTSATIGLDAQGDLVCRHRDNR